MGVPEMKDLWKALTKKNREGNLSKDEATLYKNWGKALRFLPQNPRHPGLASHEVDALSRRYGEKVWQSYLENNTPGAGRMFWVYRPGKAEITVIGLEPHPEDTKSTRKYNYRPKGKRRPAESDDSADGASTQRFRWECDRKGWDCQGLPLTFCRCMID